jgi:hypothetical protein
MHRQMNRYVRATESCFERMQYREAMIEGWDKMQVTAHSIK